MKQEDRDKPDALEAGATAANAPVHAGGEAPPPDREELAPTEEFVAVEEPPAAEEQEPVPPPPPPPQNGTSPPVSPGPDEAGTLLLTKAAHDVRILVSYLSRRDRKKLEGANLDLTGADRIASGDYSVQLEADLWRQLGQLSEAARPASAESIADSRYFVTISGTETEQQSRAGKKLRRVRFAAVAALVLTFVLGVYVSLTSTAVVQTRADIAERHRIILGQYENTRAALDRAQPPDGQANSEAQEGAGAAGAAETADALSPER